MGAQLHLHRNGQAADAFANLLRLTVGEVQPHVAATLVAVVGVKAIAGNEGHVFRQSRGQQRLRVTAFRHRHPQEQPALGMGPGHFAREVLVQSVEHGVAALAIDLANELDVLVEEAVAGDFIGDVLVEGGGVQVRGLLQLHQLADDVFRRDDPGQADSGRQRL